MPFNTRFPDRRVTLLLALALLTIPSQASATDFYFMTVYGAERPVINRPKYSHTWATFIHLKGEGNDLRRYRAHAFTISWVPRTLEVRPLDLRPEPGINLHLQDTLAYCDKNRAEISQFGPYQIQPELWTLAFKRLVHLESGEHQYRAADIINPRTEDVSNCIYAVLDLEHRDPAFRPVTLGFGVIGSAFVARRLSTYMIEPKRTYPWVSEMIGVENYRCPPLAKLLGP